MNTVFIFWLFSFGVLSANENEKHTRCKNNASIVFLLPWSQYKSSLTIYLEDFLLHVVNYLEITEYDFKISILEYSPTIRKQSKFHTSRKLTNTEISSIGSARDQNFQNGELFLKPILGKAFMSITNGTETYRKKIIVIFLNQNIMDIKESSDYANYTKQSGLIYYVLTSFKGSIELALRLASDPCKAFVIDNYRTGMDDIIADLGNNICLASDPTLAVTSGPDTIGNCNIGKWFSPPEIEQQHVCEKDGLFPDHLNCAYFYKCTNGKGKGVHLKCEGGSMFDGKSQTCNHKEAVPCYTGVSCPDDTGLFPYPGDCYKFLNCYQGIPYVQSCPFALVFDRVAKRCLLPTHALC